MKPRTPQRQLFLRTSLCITPAQHAALAYEAASKGVSMSELVRRLLDQHLQPKERTR